MKTLVIAEAGVNHNGDIDLARKMIRAAAVAGADIVKFQTFVASRLVTAGTKKAAYQAQTTDAAEGQLGMLQRLELSPEMHDVLISECRASGVEFLSTAFDAESLDMLAALGVARFKVPSGEITNLPYLRQIARHGKPVILSTGMATLGDIEAAIDVMERAGTSRDRLTVLHCTTEYPTPMSDVNLRAMLAIREAFGVAVGYSDHTPGIEVATAAVAMGATVIEKHFTLDRELPGPDHQASLEPEELRAMITAIRNIERALGDGVKRLTASETDNRSLIRKSIVAARAIEPGEAFTELNLTVKRPGTGISPMQWDDILGRIASRHFSPNDLIEL